MQNPFGAKALQTDNHTGKIKERNRQTKLGKQYSQWNTQDTKDGERACFLRKKEGKKHTKKETNSQRKYQRKKE